jgi:hypothetical protein
MVTYFVSIIPAMMPEAIVRSMGFVLERGNKKKG